MLDGCEPIDHNDWVAILNCIAFNSANTSLDLDIVQLQFINCLYPTGLTDDEVAAIAIFQFFNRRLPR